MNVSRRALQPEIAMTEKLGIGSLRFPAFSFEAAGYSTRSVVIGSTRVARIAGMTLAAIPITARITAAPIITAGSRGDIP